MLHNKANDLMEPLELLAGSIAVANRRIDNLDTSYSGSVSFNNKDGSMTVIGPMAGDFSLATHVGDTTPPPIPTGISVRTGNGTVSVMWDGTLEDEIPADFLQVNLYINGEKFASLDCEGTVFTPPQEAGTVVAITATSEDDACNFDGTPAHNESGHCDPIEIEVRDLFAEGAAEREELRKEAEELKATTPTKTELEQKVDEVKGQILDTVAAEYVDKETGATLATKTELEQTATSISSSVEQNYAKKDDLEGLADKSLVEQTAASITASVESNYLKKDDAEAAYATKAALKVEADRITATATETAGLSERTSALEQTAQGLTVTMKETQDKADKAQETAEGIADTANSALDLASAAQEQVNQSSETTANSIANLNASIAQNSNILAELQEAGITDLSAMVRIVQQSGIPLLQLGSSTSQLWVQLSNSQLTFMDGDAAVAYVSGMKLYISQAEVSGSLGIGNFAFLPRANGNVCLKKVM